jgi:hypothetical protein
MLIEHMASGLSIESFAGVINCSIDSLYEWVKVHSNFSEAKKRGTAQSLLYYEKLGRAMADPRIDTSKSNSTVWIYQMKCRFNRMGWNPIGQDFNNDTGDDFEFK